MPNYSIVEYFADHSGYKCGYCKNPTSAFSQGMWAHSLNVEDYQQLIDRGWRRSGQYCYKPTMQKTCCPQYAIRCLAKDFKFTKSKKKVTKRMQQFVLNGDQKDIERWKEKCKNMQSTADGEGAQPDELPNVESSAIDSSLIKTVNNAGVSVTATVKSGVPGKSAAASSSDPTVKKALKMQSASDETNFSTRKREPKKGCGADPSKPVCRKAKEIRREKKLKKMNEKGGNDAQPSAPLKNQEPKPLEAFLPHLNSAANAKHKIEVRLVRNGTAEFSRSADQSFSLYQRYQCAIHKDTLSDCDRKQWKRFLVESPLNFDPRGPGKGFGSFHNQYWMDDKLIAVGVVDILPKCVSSVYLYYDPDYGFLSLGIYSALSEIALTKQLQAEDPDIAHYYMGYYIHSCPKMKYKGAYDPSDLLCPETYSWVPVKKCVATLDMTKYARLNVLDGGSPDTRDLEGLISYLSPVRCLYQRNILTYGMYKQCKIGCVPFFDEETFELGGGDDDNAQLTNPDDSAEDAKVREYVSLVGRTCAKRMLLYRQ